MLNTKNHVAFLVLFVFFFSPILFASLIHVYQCTLFTRAQVSSGVSTSPLPMSEFTYRCHFIALRRVPS